MPNSIQLQQQQAKDSQNEDATKGITSPHNSDVSFDYDELVQDAPLLYSEDSSLLTNDITVHNDELKSLHGDLSKKSAIFVASNFSNAEEAHTTEIKDFWSAFFADPIECISDKTGVQNDSDKHGTEQNYDNEEQRQLRSTAQQIGELSGWKYATAFEDV
ncbi:hypothetical protein BWQ96_10300 [Gracilariopsis chorda]|uniref:Uncharacterized protein n=1 Tax=Gracilariopsis chorda TaxID=448386 RepID=A0A2V3ID27_9FLOR|nr:hypothetical protein BWQ96_10300 [Gracilariopsis chorda]|eukprot:PXF39995.1 hypothetical protein BWQ96_10300 [Gracilariopsis chorda]